MKTPIELLPLFQERIWGRPSLAPLFADELITTNNSDTVRIGEVWFSFTGNRTSAGTTLGELLEKHPELLGTGANPDHPGVCPILVKLLFTTERLSVQVHPDDSYAREHHKCLGKTEAWYILDSEAAGEVAVGFREEITVGRFRDGIASGEIETLLDWRKVQPGDVIFTPAGTVHAIGAGLTVCEIQENSDITYRLYDYGRPRELHIDHGVQVSHLAPHRYEAKPVALSAGRDELSGCEYFRIERLRPLRSIHVRAGLPHYGILICTRGTGSIGGEPCRAGQAWFIPASGSGIEIDAADSEWILTYRNDVPSGLVQVD